MLPELDRMLETCVKNEATDILLLPGMPPFLRVENGLRALSIGPLTDDDLERLVEKYWSPQRVNDAGYLEFDISYGEHWFRVAAFDAPTPQFIIMMRFPRPEPATAATTG